MIVNQLNIDLLVTSKNSHTRPGKAIQTLALQGSAKAMRPTGLKLLPRRAKQRYIVTFVDCEQQRAQVWTGLEA